MVHAVDVSDSSRDPSLDTTLEELRSVIATAYDHVKLARRYMNSFPDSASLSARLQLAEAELVRAKVALVDIEQSTVRKMPLDQPAVIRGAPFGKNRRSGNEYRN